MKTKILVIGATGKTGLPVVEQAIEAGLDVRAVIRREDDRSDHLKRAGAETVLGDVHDMKSVRGMVKDVERIYFAYPPHLEKLVEATANISIAAKDAGVSALINMSQLPVRENARSALTRQHWLSEKIFDSAGIGAIHIRPTFFAENLLMFNAETIAVEKKIYLPYGERGHAPIPAFDIARVIVSLLQNSKSYVGERLILTGLEIFTINEIANLIGNEIGEAVEYVNLPEEQWLDLLTNQVGLPAFLAKHLYNVSLDHQDGIFNVQTKTVEEITGTPPQSLVSFIRENMAKFTGKESMFLGV